MSKGKKRATVKKVAEAEAPRGRPTLYTDDIASEILHRIADGESLRSVCRDERMPAAATVHGWVIDDREGFSDRYARAREVQIEGWADEVLEMADDGSNDWMEKLDREGEPTGYYMLNREAVLRSKLRVDTRKWLMAKVMPKRYGEKTQMELAGKDGGPVEVRVTRTIVRPDAGR